jgi:dolichol-phosphate mannosyltransferase
MKNPKIAVVIPCYKVENSITRVISQIPSFVDSIIVVNDGSPDGSLAKIKSSTDPRVTLISHARNQGVGGAMLTGYSYGLQNGAQILAKVDGDGQMDPDYLQHLITPIADGEADYVKGNRFLHPNELRRMPLFRRIGNLGLSFLTKVASGYWNIFDPTNGYTAISSSALCMLDPQKISKNYFFETSMLCELRKIQSVVKDVSIPAVYNDEHSSLHVFNQLFVFPFNLIKKFFYRIYYEYFLFDFTAVSFYIVLGVLLGLFGMIWGIVKWSLSSQTGIPATTGTVLIAVLPLILAVQFLVQAVTLDINGVPARVKRDFYTETQGKLKIIDYYNKQVETGQIRLEKVDGKNKN